MDRCAFGAGEEIIIFVQYDNPVIVAGSGPRLKLNVLNHLGDEI